MRIIYKGNIYESFENVNPEEEISKYFTKVGPGQGWNNNTWLVGPKEGEDGAYYIYKEENYPFELVRLYHKETFNQHHKGDGSEDFTEVLYSTRNYQDIIKKANQIKSEFPAKREEPINEDAGAPAPVAPAPTTGVGDTSSAITTNDMPAYYGKPRIFEKRRA